MANQDAQTRHTRVQVNTGPPIHLGMEDTSGSPQLPDGAATTAILAWHGMGQQLPFETVELVARTLAKREGQRHNGNEPVVTVRLASLGTQTLWRAELDVRGANGRSHRVHVYEAYWAPYTAGKITLRETIGFMVDAGWRCMRDYIRQPREFERYLFGEWVTFKLKTRVVLEYLLMFAALAALIVVNFAMTTVIPVKLLTGPGSATSWPSYALLKDLTVDLGWLALTLGALGLALLMAYKSEEVNRLEARTSTPRRSVRLIIQALIATSVTVTVLVGILVSVHLIVDILSDGAGSQSPGWPYRVIFGQKWPTWGIGHLIGTFVVWAVALGASVIVRWFLLEFVGDVAIYVSSHKLDRFHETRQAIKETSLATAKAIYDVGGYDRHILIGHSLGSVIAYDTLNRLIIEDQLSGGSASVTRRTRLFTIGSILDTTAFLFRLQSKSSDVREALAGVMQPLISDPASRPTWINIYSPEDGFGGAIEYYDVPNQPAPPLRVDNRVDSGAWIPVIAHGQYWTDRLLLDELVKAITS